MATSCVMNNQGFSLIELLLALAILSLAILAFGAGLLYANATRANAYAEERGDLLAQQCIAVTRFLRDASGFSALGAGTWGIERDAMGWHLVAAPEGLIRTTVQIVDESISLKRIVCTVAWSIPREDVRILETTLAP